MLTNQQRARNNAIIRLREGGTKPVDIAARFDLTPTRVRQVIARSTPVEQRRAKLRQRYGSRPDISLLPDGTPIDVLLLCDTRVHGWSARINRLRGASIRLQTLGDLRDTPDEQLLRIPRIGMQLLAELRTFCPYRGP